MAFPGIIFFRESEHLERFSVRIKQGGEMKNFDPPLKFYMQLDIVGRGMSHPRRPRGSQ